MFLGLVVTLCCAVVLVKCQIRLVIPAKAAGGAQGAGIHLKIASAAEPALSEVKWAVSYLFYTRLKFYEFFNIFCYAIICNMLPYTLI